MKRMLFLFALHALLALPMPGAAQNYDLLTGFHGETTYRYTRTGIPSTFMGGDTTSQFAEFDGTVLIRGDENYLPDGSAIIHSLAIRKRGMETIRTSRRIVSQQMLDVMVQDTIFETVGDGEGAGGNSLRGWVFPDSTWNSPPCPGIPDTTILYPYARMYRYYTPAAADSLDERNGFLHLRMLLTDCLDNAWRLEFHISRFSGRNEILISTFNFFDWSVDECYVLTLTPSVDEPGAPLSNRITLSCHPNPVGRTTTVRCELGQADRVQLLVHDIQGRIIRLLHQGPMTAGLHEFAFDASDLPNGVYACTLLTGDTAYSTQLMLLR